MNRTSLPRTPVETNDAEGAAVAIKSDGAIPGADELTHKSCSIDQTNVDFVVHVLVELAAADDLLQNPRITAAGLESVFGAIDPLVRYVGETTTEDEGETTGADQRFLLRTAKGDDFYVMQTDDAVWLDVSRMSPGEGGSRIYAAVSEYAYNSGRTFIGDPAGLSVKALRRRTEAMLSSALKRGTTRHLAPHPYQVEGDARQGVPPLDWTEGDDLANLRSLIAVSTANFLHIVPEATDARYDFSAGTFRDAAGEPLSDGMLDGWATAASRMRAQGIGRATVKRGILLNTLACTPSRTRPELLERALRQQRQLVGRGLGYIVY